jgi:L-rhamnose mutarotase
MHDPPIAFRMMLKPGMAENIAVATTRSGRLAEALRAAGIYDYSIFLTKRRTRCSPSCACIPTIAATRCLASRSCSGGTIWPI